MSKGKARQIPAAATKGEDSSASAPSGASIPPGATTQAPRTGSKRTYKDMDSDPESSTPDPPPPAFRCLRNRVITIQPPVERPPKRTKARHSDGTVDENAHISSTSSPREPTPPISDTPMASTSTSTAPAAPQPLERVPTEIIEQPTASTPPAGPSHAPPTPLHIDLSPIHIDLSPIPADALPCPPSPVPTEIYLSREPQTNEEIQTLLKANGIKIRDFAYEDERYKRMREEIAGGDTVVLEESAVPPPPTTHGNGQELRAQGGKVWSQVIHEQEAQAPTSASVDDSKERVQDWLASGAYTSHAPAGPQPLQRQKTHEDIQTESPRKATNRQSLARISSNSMLVAVM